MQINDITGQIVDAAIKVHRVLGPGLLESAYEACLLHELRSRGLSVQAGCINSASLREPCGEPTALPTKAT